MAQQTEFIQAKQIRALMIREKGAEFVNEVSVEITPSYTFFKKWTNKEQNKCVLQMLETYVTRLLN